ncbi:MAG: radical SAM protein [Nitrospirae bacterium]|nr:radical SAM protein [Nitrospirota bacterium]
MSIKRAAKNTVKKVVSPVILKNLRGLSDAAASYYPDYVFCDGKIEKLKSVSIEVTFKCNCRCKMCPLYGVHTDGGGGVLETIRKEKELTTEEFSTLFKQLKNAGVRSVRFSGGEAFIRKDILELIKMAKEHMFELSITSNGGVISEDAARKIVEYGLDDLTISLDGPRDVHNKIRCSNVFDNIMKTVDLIKEQKAALKKSKPDVGFLCTVSALNQDSLCEVVRISREKEVPLTIDPIIFTDENTIGDTKSQVAAGNFFKQESFLLPEDIAGVDVGRLKQELDCVRRLAKELGQSVYVSIDNDDELERFFKDKDFSVVNKCFAPWYSLRIDPYGNVYPCSLSTLFGNVRESTVQEIINNEKYVAFRRKLKEKRLFPFCKKCCLLYSPQKYWNYLPKI